jgi:hypothetical protein
MGNEIDVHIVVEYAPASSNLIFPPPPSSAGVPKRMTLPGRENFVRAAAAASAAPTEQMAIRL